MVKNLSALFLFTLLVIGFSGCDIPYYEKLVIADTLNVRSSPNGPVIDSVSVGQKVDVFEIRGDWSRIGRNKWVASEYLSDQIINESSQNPGPRPSQSPSARTVDIVYLSCGDREHNTGWKSGAGPTRVFLRLGFDEDARSSNRNKVPEEHIRELISSETYMLVWNGNPLDNQTEALLDSGDKFGIHPSYASESRSDNEIDFSYDEESYDLDRVSLALEWSNYRYISNARGLRFLNLPVPDYATYRISCRRIAETDYLASIANIRREANNILQARQDKELRESLEQVQRRRI